MSFKPETNSFCHLSQFSYIVPTFNLTYFGNFQQPQFCNLALFCPNNTSSISQHIQPLQMISTTQISNDDLFKKMVPKNYGRILENWLDSEKSCEIPLPEYSQDS
jgi:hypothetical protein